MISLLKIIEERSEWLFLEKSPTNFYLRIKGQCIILSKNLDRKSIKEGYFQLLYVNNLILSNSPIDYYSKIDSEKEELLKYIVEYDEALNEISRKKFNMDGFFKPSGRVFLTRSSKPNYSQFTVGFDYSTEEEVFCVPKLNWPMSNNLIELFGDYLFYLADDGLHCQDTKIKMDLWVQPNEILEDHSLHFKFLKHKGQVICYNLWDGFVSYNIISGEKNWTWPIYPEVYYRYSLSNDGVLHLIEEDWYIQLDAETGREISRICFMPSILEKVKNPLSKVKAGMANPIATKTHLLFGTQGALFLINRSNGEIDFLHELEDTFKIYPTLDIDENKIIYTCTDNLWPVPKSKAVFLVFEENFEI